MKKTIKKSMLALLTSSLILTGGFLNSELPEFKTVAEASTKSIEEIMNIPLESPIAKKEFSSNFGMRTMKSNGYVVHRMHEGVDIATKRGTDLYAVSDGKIRSVNKACSQEGFYNGQGGGCLVNGKQMGWGNYVQIEFPNGYYVVYAHMSTIPEHIKVGATVKKGEVIGQSGNTGNTTGPHLHFELRTPEGKAIDPQFILKKENRIEIEEAERKAKEEAERKAKEEAERKAKEEEERRIREAKIKAHLEKLEEDLENIEMIYSIMKKERISFLPNYNNQITHNLF